MTLATAIMYMVAMLAGAAGLWLLVRWPRRRSEAARYAHLMVGTMAAALALILSIFATAMWSWETAR